MALDPRHVARDILGIHESPEEARTYLRHEAGNSFDEERVDAFLENGPEAVDLFIAHTAAALRHAAGLSDYHAEAPGGAQGAVDGHAAVRRARARRTQSRISARPLPELTVFGMMLGSGKDIMHFMRAARSLTSALYVAQRLARHFRDVMKHGRGMTLTNGNALADGWRNPRWTSAFRSGFRPRRRNLSSRVAA